MSAEFVTAFKSRFPMAVDRASADHPAFNLPYDEVVPALRFLRDQWGFELLMDLTAIDGGPGTEPRFTVVYHLLAPNRGATYVRIAAPCAGPEDEPAAPSVVGLWPGANWHERECWDMFGIRFDGHPDLRRILMWDGYPYHPLRKEFPLAGVETDLPVADIQEETGTRVVAAPMAGGPFVASTGEVNLTEAEPRALDQSWSDRRVQPGQTPLRQVKE
ncbi:MAG: NADH-quinone oxidoreductase subunit C [Verrucomicrobia bacterium]|nr:NADH-quinone oxidoreductase subunit C [Verrucomicrobiota bacterium]